MPELGLSSTYDYSTATSNRKKSIFLVIGVTGISPDPKPGVFFHMLWSPEPPEKIFRSNFSIDPPGAQFLSGRATCRGPLE